MKRDRGYTIPMQNTKKHPHKKHVGQPIADRAELATSRPHDHRGLLIVVEGVDGSGKSTQLDLLGKWLESNGFAVARTEWNSSPSIKPITKTIKKSETIVSPETYALLHLADFAERYATLIEPNLRAGKVVLCDRYIYTAFARDTARGLPLAWLRDLYVFAPTPDLALYFKVKPEVAISRKVSMPNFYEAGMDLNLSTNIKTSFDIFQRRVIEGYESIAENDGITTVSGETDIFVTFPKVRDMVAQKIKAKYDIDL